MNLFLWLRYDRAGNGACLKRYSDPSYFRRAWATSEPEKAQQIQKEKKLKKIKVNLCFNYNKTSGVVVIYLIYFNDFFHNRYAIGNL